MNTTTQMAMSMQLGGPAAPRLRSSHVDASWTAVAACAPAFGTGHVSSLGLTQKTEHGVIAGTKANPAYGHRQPEEIST